MYKIEKTPWGYRLQFQGFMQKDEMNQWVQESERTLNTDNRGSFNIFVDMRNLKPLTPDAKQEMQAGQKLYKNNGMERSVVIVDNPTTKLQFKNIAKKSGIYQWERYVDASSNQNWEKAALDWINEGIDPDA